MHGMQREFFQKGQLIQSDKLSCPRLCNILSAYTTWFGSNFSFRVIYPTSNLLTTWKVAASRQSALKIMDNPVGSVRSEALRDVESIRTYLVQCNRLAIEIHLCPLHFLQISSASYLSASSIDSMTTTAPCYSCKSAIKPLLPNWPSGCSRPSFH